MHKRMNPREQKRMMQRMGMNMDTVADVQQVIIKTSDKDIVIDEPEVAILEVQGQKMYQVIGGQISEQAASQRQLAKAWKKQKKLWRNAKETWQKLYCYFKHNLMDIYISNININMKEFG